MKSAEIEHALDVASRTAHRAGSLVMRGFRSDVSVTKKGVIDLVTEWDLRSEELIREELLQSFPDHAVIGEEGDSTGSGERVWYVDPIDGTTNFSQGHPFFCVSIALYEGDTPLVGVVYAPALQTEWRGASGLGATRNGEPCLVSPASTLEDALVATGFPYDRWVNPDDNLREYRAFMKCTRGVRRCGSAALDLAMTADGTYAAFWEQRLNAWDMAAGALLVQLAGGQLSDYDGSPGEPRSGRIVATNARLHDQVLETLQKARKSEAPRARENLDV